MLDWNWFFSALAQSSAAIVAFFGGFIATKIISNQGDHARLRREIHQCLLECKKFVERGKSVKFSTVIEADNSDAIYHLRREIDKTNGERTPEYYYSNIEHEFSDYLPHTGALELIGELIIQKQKEPEIFLSKSPRVWLGSTGGLERDNYLSRIQEARDEIRELAAEANHQSRLASSLVEEAKANPYSSKLLQFSAISVLILFFVGVIYPLSFMPSDNNIQLSFLSSWDILTSFRGGLLAAISIIFSTVLIVLLISNFRLSISEAQINELNEYSDPHYFSEFFQIARNTMEYKNKLKEVSLS